MDMDIMSTLFKLAEKYSFSDKLLTSFQDSLASGLSFGVSGTRRQMRKQQQYALEQMKVQQGYALAQMAEQQRLNREQYDYEYDKESPASRVQQLRQAGLNSGLMYGSGAGGAGMQGSVGTVSTPSGPSAHGPSASGFESSLASLMMASKQNALLDSEIKANEALAEERLANAADKRGDTKESGQRILGLKLDNRIKTVNANIAEVTETDQIGITKERFEQLKNENENLIMDLSVKLSQIDSNSAGADYIREQMYGQMTQNAILEIKLHYQDKMSSAELQKMEADIQKCFADTSYVKQLNLTEKEKTEVEKLCVEAQKQVNQIGKVQAKHMSDGFGRFIHRLDTITSMVGKVFGASDSYVHKR